MQSKIRPTVDFFSSLTPSSPPFHLSVCPSICLSVRLSIHSHTLTKPTFTHLPLHPPTHDPLIFSLTSPPTYLSSHSFIYSLFFPVLITFSVSFAMIVFQSHRTSKPLESFLWVFSSTMQISSGRYSVVLYMYGVQINFLFYFKSS